jgi:hypothetical protein
MPHIMETNQLTTADLANAANARDREESRDFEPASPDRHEVPDTNGFQEEHSESLLPQNLSDDMRNRWQAIQTEFVDDPRVSVQRADELVATAIKSLAESFAEERAKLEKAWSKGNDVSTEDLRQALRRYRAFFQRLLSV